jgi:hypothetical protein
MGNGEICNNSVYSCFLNAEMRIIGRLIAYGLFASAALTAAARAGTSPHRGTPGFSYRHDQIPAGPWSAHIVTIDRSNPNLELHTTLPPGPRFGLVNLSAQVKGLGVGNGHVLAAINGDYYEGHSPYRGDPQGLQIMRGELVSAPFDWTCFWIDSGGKPTMGKVDARFRVTMADGSLFPFGLNEARAKDAAVIYTSVVGPTTRTRGGIELILEPWRLGPQLPFRAGERYFARVVEINQNGNSTTATNRLVLSIGPNLLKEIAAPGVGDRIRISTATSPGLKNVQTAIGGGPAILHDRKPAFPHQAHVRHPRSVIGWNDKSIFLVEVDGRQRNLSVGMTFEELSAYLLKIGCTDAMCLDGGGSSTLWALGQVMNNPCEGAERGAANGLVVINTERR